MEKETRKSESTLVKTPGGQGILDNIWLLLGLGLGLPFIIYMLWAVLELLHVPSIP